MGQNTNHQVSPNLSETWAECLESDMLRQEIMVKIHIFASDTHGGIVTFNTFQSILDSDPSHVIVPTDPLDMFSYKQSAVVRPRKRITSDRDQCYCLYP